MKSRLCLLTPAVVASLLSFTGCKTTRNAASEIDGLVNAVAYDTSDPRALESAAPEYSPIAPVDTGSELADDARSIRQAVNDGLKMTAYILLYGVVKVMEAITFDDDDDDDYYTPRGGADRNFNHWLESRERWRQDD